MIANLKLKISVLAAVALLGCSTPHSPTRVLPKSSALIGIDSSSGYVYDELLSDGGLQLDKDGHIQGASPAWIKKALGRTLDLQQALDECQAEKRALIGH